MHDFNCTRADDMNYELMAERTRYLEEGPEGVKEMCQIMEEMRTESLKKGIKQGAVNSAKRMIEAGKYGLEEIVNISGLSLEEVEKLQMHLNV